MKKNSEGFKIEIHESATVDLTFRDVDGAMTAHLSKRDIEALCARLLVARDNIKWST